MFEVWPENWDAVQLFLKVQTQWRTGSSSVIGLDYAAIEMVCKIKKIDLTEQLFNGLRIIEMAALSALNERK